jgi:WD40 repeat protein
LIFAAPSQQAIAIVPLNAKSILQQQSGLTVRAFDINANDEVAIAYTSGFVEVLDDTGATISSMDFSATQSATVRGIAWASAPRDHLLAVNVTGEDRYVAIWDVSTNQVSRVEQDGFSINFDWSDDGALIAVIYATGISEFFDTTFVTIWDVDNASIVLRLEEPGERLNAIAWRPAYDEVALGTSSGNVYFWDTDNGVRYDSFAAHTEAVLDISWSPTGNQLATVGRDFVAKTWDQASNNMLSALSLDSYPTQVLWRPNSAIEVAVVETPFIVVFDAVSGNLLTTIDARSGRAESIWAIWTLDGNSLVYSAYNNPAQNALISTAIVPTVTPSPTLTGTPPTSTPTLTFTPSNTPTKTLTPTSTATKTPTATATPTLTPTLTPTATNTPTGTVQPTLTPSNTPTPPPSTLFLQYYPESTTRTTYVESIIPQLNIVNSGAVAVNLSELKIRYYFTKDSTTQGLEGYCAWTGLPGNCDNVTVTTGTLTTPVTGADSYIEVGFTSGTVDANSQTLDIIVRANKLDWSDFDQSNDYSFDPTSTSDTWVDWTKVTLFRNGVLVWGTEPQ